MKMLKAQLFGTGQSLLDKADTFASILYDHKATYVAILLFMYQ